MRRHKDMMELRAQQPPVDAAIDALFDEHRAWLDARADDLATHAQLWLSVQTLMGKDNSCPETVRRLTACNLLLDAAFRQLTDLGEPWCENFYRLLAMIVQSRGLPSGMTMTFHHDEATAPVKQ